MASSSDELLASITRWASLSMTVLCWILSVVTMGACDFYEVNYLQDKSNGIGIFTVQENGSTCTSYENLGLDLDSGIEASRTFGIFTNFALLLCLAMNVVLHTLANNGESKDFVVRVAIAGYCSAFLFNLFTFSISGSDGVKRVCQSDHRDCTLGSAGGAAVANVFILLLTFAIFCYNAENFATNASSVSRKVTGNRAQRLKNGDIKVLYHQTDQDSVSSIQRSRRLMRGSSGLAGGGIYFAESQHETHGKAHKTGYMAICKVQLGKVKKITAAGDSSMTFQKLQSEGYDSVYITRVGGNEYVVYNFDQVEVVDVTKL